MVAREGCPGLPGLPPGARLAAGLTTDPATREGRLKKKKKVFFTLNIFSRKKKKKKEKRHLWAQQLLNP